jgi:hypothetical protein
MRSFKDTAFSQMLKGHRKYKKLKCNSDFVNIDIPKPPEGGITLDKLHPIPITPEIDEWKQKWNELEDFILRSFGIPRDSIVNYKDTVYNQIIDYSNMELKKMQERQIVRRAYLAGEDRSS